MTLSSRLSYRTTSYTKIAKKHSKLSTVACMTKRLTYVITIICIVWCKVLVHFNVLPLRCCITGYSPEHEWNLKLKNMKPHSRYRERNAAHRRHLLPDTIFFASEVHAFYYYRTFLTFTKWHLLLTKKIITWELLYKSVFAMYHVENWDYKKYIWKYASYNISHIAIE